MAPGLPARRVNDKLLAVVGQVEGAAHLLASMHSCLPVSGDISARPQSSAPTRLPSKGKIVSLPRGSRLLPGLAHDPRAVAGDIAEFSVPEQSVTGSDLEVHLMDEEGDNQ